MRRGHYGHATAMRPACDLQRHLQRPQGVAGCGANRSTTLSIPFRYRCARVAPPSRRHVSTASGPCTVRARVVLKQWTLLALRRGCKRTWYASSRYAAKYARNQYPGRQLSQVATPSHRLCSACAYTSASRTPQRARWAGWPAANPPRTLSILFTKAFRETLPEAFEAPCKPLRWALHAGAAAHPYAEKTQPVSIRLQLGAKLVQ